MTQTASTIRRWPAESARKARVVLAIAVACGALSACMRAASVVSAPSGSESTSYQPSPAESGFIDTLSRRTFEFFWETTNPRNGLTPDRWPTKSFSSVAAVGFGLTAYTIGVERGWVPRQAARDRVLTTLPLFWHEIGRNY